MDDQEARELASSYGPYAVLGAVFAFMLWIRTRAAGRVITDDAVFFSGNDPWYHARIVHLTVRHFPATPDFDPWSYFPYGTGRHSGFGGLFDQLIALGALIVGLGDPSPHLIDVVTAYAPAVFGAATVVPTYLIAKRLTDRWWGLAAAGLLALLDGQFLSRTVVGAADHQSAEAFFGAIAVLGFLYAVDVAYREKPTTADVRDRNWFVLRRPVIAGVVGGVAVASYLMMWPPGVMLAFTLGVFVVLGTVRDHLDGRPTEYLTFAAAVAMLVAGLLTLFYAKSFALKATAFSLLQPLVLVGVGVGAVVLYALSDYASTEGYDRRYYPVVVAALIAGAVGLVAVVFPRGIDLLQGLVSRVYSFGLLSSPSALTVAEIQPADLDNAWRAFAAVFYLAVAGLAVMLARQVRDNRPIELVVILWSLTILSAYFTMVRFGYYLAVNVAVLGAFAVWWTARNLLSIDAVREPSDLEAYQIIGVLVLLVVIVPGNVVAVENSAPVWETSGGLGGTDAAWHDELTWLRANTPGEPLEFDRVYEPPEDGDFDYPGGAYGVISWWDYGHWITFQGRRIPDANPFQQGPRMASAYFQAESEERAELILETIPSLEGRSGSIPELSNGELREIVAEQSEGEAGEDTRYVMIDDQMAAGKFPAIATWTGPGYGAYLSRGEFQVGGEDARLVGVNDRYNSMVLARLYFGDARGMSHYRLVHETEQRSAIASVAQQTANGWQRTNFLHRIVSPGVLRTVQGRPDLAFYDIRQVSRVKTFERVEGATLTGTVDAPNATEGTPVFTTLALRTNTGRNFTYLAQTELDADGEFSMTVPYPTDDAVGPAEGGTDSGVTAIGNYTVSVGNPFFPAARGHAEVPESAVYDGRTIEVPVELVNRTGNRTIQVETGNGSALGGAPDPDGSVGDYASGDRGDLTDVPASIVAPPREIYRAGRPHVGT